MSITKKQTTIIISISAILILLIGVTLALLYISINSTPQKNDLKNDFNYLPNNKDFSQYYFDNKVEIDTSLNYELVPLETNWKTPLVQTYTMIYNEFKAPNNTITMGAVVIKFTRNNIFDFNWKIDSRLDNSIYNTSYEETKSIVSKNNIVENNPNKDKIRNIQPLTQSEIESNSKLREQEQQNLQTQEEFNNKSVIERKQICFEILERIKNDLQNAKNGNFTNTEPSQKQTKEEYIAITEPSIPDLEKTCNELK